MRVAIQTPFEIVTKLRIIYIGGSGNFPPGIRLIALSAIRAEAVGPASEAVHVVAIPVEALDQLHLRFDEEVAVRGIPAAQDVLLGDIFRSDGFFAGGIEDLPIRMFLLEPRSHVHADHFADNFGAFGVSEIDAGPEFLDRLFRNRLAGEDVEDFAMRAE